MKFTFVAKRGANTNIDMADDFVVEKSLRFKFLSRIVKFILSPMEVSNRVDFNSNLVHKRPIYADL